MSIFKRRDEQQAGDTLPSEMGAPGGVETATRTTAVPGVVPPPAAPIYSTRRPDPADRFEFADHPVSDSVTVTAAARRRAQEIQGRLEVAVQRRRSAASGATPRRREAVRHPAAEWTATSQSPMPIDPARFAQTGLLNLAWSWQQAGAPIRAIHAYMQLLSRYPDSPAAAAAVADLVEISEKLAEEGQFHTALAIYDRLEELLS